MIGPALATMILVCGQVEVGDARVVAEGPLVGEPAAAFGDGIFLVTWRQGWAGMNATADILGVRLSARTLEPLDRTPIRICAAPEAQYAPRVSSNGTGFLVIWQDMRNGVDLDVRGALVEAKTGAVRRGEIPIAVGSGNQARPAVAQCAGGFLVVWQDIRDGAGYDIRGGRVSARGEVLDRRAFRYSDRGAAPAACGSGDRVLICWGSGAHRGGTSAALIDASTGGLSVSLGTINTPCQNQTAIAHDGAGDFMTVSARTPFPDPWGWGGPGAVVCSRVKTDGTTPDAQLDYGYRQTRLSERKVPNVVDAATWKGSKGGMWNAGAPGGFPGTTDGLWPSGQPAVAYAGGGLYLFAWVRTHIRADRLSLADADIWLRGMDGRSLAVRVPDRALAAEGGVDETSPVLAAGSPGELLLVYERTPGDQPPRIVVRSIHLP